MVRFTEYAKEKLIISIKLIPTGIKAWVIADKGYFLYWFWYAKGEGLQEIGQIPRALGRNKIAVVISALLKTLPQAPPSIYSVILNNLFTFIKFLVYFS